MTSKNSLVEFTDFINRNKWVFIKNKLSITQPDEYLEKDKLNNEDKKIFDEFTIYIKEKGYKTSTKYSMIYFDIGKYQYWTKKSTIKNNIILNRKTIDKKKLLLEFVKSKM